MLEQPDNGHAEKLKAIAEALISICDDQVEQVLGGPQSEDNASSTLRMLANRNGVQLKQPGEFYRLNKPPSRRQGLSDHHHFAWTSFSPHVMWEQ